MSLRALKIPFGFFATGIIWAIVSDPLITFFCKELSQDTRDIIRVLNDCMFVGTISIVLYFGIKKQNKRLVDSEEQYRSLFELNPSPMWIYEKQSLKFVKVNQAAIDQYGYTANEFLGMSIFDIRPADEHKKLMDRFALLDNKISHAGNWKHITKSGKLLYASIVTYDLTFDDKPCRLVMANNITDLIMKEQKIKDQNVILHQIAWSNSHEVRRSLCSVMGLIALLKDATTEKERLEYIQLLEECSYDFDKILKNNGAKIDDLKEY